jgi:hypothetical protein
MLPTGAAAGAWKLCRRPSAGEEPEPEGGLVGGSSVLADASGLAAEKERCSSA